MKIKGLQLLLCSIMILVSTQQGWAQGSPIARAVPLEGTLEYKKGDNNWAAVTRPKYLFETYSIRTLENSSARLVLLSDNTSALLSAYSEAEIRGSSIVVVRGEMGETEDENNTILASLSTKFENAQRFITVRRQSPCDEMVRPANAISLSNEYPELVWKNACPTYSYRLTVGSSSFDVPPAGEADLVRYAVSGLGSGEYEYKIEVLDRGRTLYSPRSSSTLVWIDDATSTELSTALDQLDNDIFLMADLLESLNLLIPALDLYREFFNSNTEDNDMRPFLIMSYAGLGLQDLQADEARLYNMLNDG
ncbi:MAG: hypothetical protein QGG67_11435 [Gammaproteobacteria bacterium]|nr:hypothetical protein [Gammaproteobacteria bacterium]|tara:strand:- start:3950 stop:4870 length:921 start_codon:yes stop_codon:yes gene_type:complete